MARSTGPNSGRFYPICLRPWPNLPEQLLAPRVAPNCCIPGTPSKATNSIMDWDDYFLEQAAQYRQLADKTEDALIKQELLDLAAVCEEVAHNISDRQTGG
jgi:hypothetical protein